MLIIVLQRKVLHVFCYHDSSLCSLYETQNKIIFHSSLLAPFVDSYYSPRGQHDRTPGRFYYRKFTEFWAEFGYGKYLIVPFWHASAAYQANLVPRVLSLPLSRKREDPGNEVAYQARLLSPWVFWLDCVSPKYEPWLNQTRLICRRSVPKRYD